MLLLLLLLLRLLPALCARPLLLLRLVLPQLLWWRTLRLLRLARPWCRNSDRASLAPRAGTDRRHARSAEEWRAAIVQAAVAARDVCARTDADLATASARHRPLVAVPRRSVVRRRSAAAANDLR
jgi:hypothetical protein